MMISTSTRKTSPNSRRHRFIPPLHTTRAAPQSLSITYHDDGRGHAYWFDSRTTNRRTSLPIPQTGYPNVDHTRAELEDVRSFLAVLGNVPELAPLVQYVAKVVGGVPQFLPAPPQSIEESSSTNAFHELFDKPISSIQLQVGQEPIIKFYSTREEPQHEIKVKMEDCNVDITLPILDKLCHKFEFSNGEHVSCRVCIFSAFFS